MCDCSAATAAADDFSADDVRGIIADCPEIRELKSREIMERERRSIGEDDRPLVFVPERYPLQAYDILLLAPMSQGIGEIAAGLNVIPHLARNTVFVMYGADDATVDIRKAGRKE